MLITFYDVKNMVWCVYCHEQNKKHLELGYNDFANYLHRKNMLQRSYFITKSESK